MRGAPTPGNGHDAPRRLGNPDKTAKLEGRHQAKPELVGSPRHGLKRTAVTGRAAPAITEASVGRTHLAITVELVHGSHVGNLWPRPGRVLVAPRSATFEQLAAAIDDGFARWDHSHLHEFTLAGGTVITSRRWPDGDEPAGSLDGAKTGLARLRLGEQFAYVFDLGDGWQHLCTVGPKLADPLESLGIVPDRPLPCWGWGAIPDQYGRRWNGDDGSTTMPPAPDGLGDLPAILPAWGPRPPRGPRAAPF